MNPSMPPLSNPERVRFGLRTRLIAVMASAAALFVVLAVVMQDPLLELQLARATTTDLEALARQALAEVHAGAEADEVADRLGARRGARLQVYAREPKGADDQSLRLLGDTAGAPEPSQDVALDALSTPPLEAGTAVTQTIREERTQVLQLVLPTEHYVITAARPLTQMRAVRESLVGLLLTAGGLILGLVILATAYLSRTIVQPIRELTVNADHLAMGDYSQRLALDRSDELGILSASLNRMADRLKAQIRSTKAEGARFRTVLNTMEEAVLVVGTNRCIVHTNRRFDRLFGQPAPGDPLTAVLIGTTVETALETCLSADTDANHVREYEVQLPTRMGSEPRYFNAHVAALPKGEGVIAVLHDISKMRLTDQVRRDFIANASHELRTPLTAVRGFAETLTTTQIDDAATRERFLHLILKNTMRLERLVDDMLTLSKSESGEERLTLTPVAVAPIISDVVRTWESQAADKDIRIRWEPPAEAAEPSMTAQAHEQSLDQILVNLVENAVKYTENGGEVRVNLEDAATHITISVTDTGPGIPPEHQARVFERFYRVDTGRSRALGGTGLGLSIVRHLVSRLNGTIVLDSTPGQGSTFSVTLPRA